MMDMSIEGFVDIDEAVSWGRNEVRENYKKYVNPGLVQLMSLLDFDKRFVRAEGIKVWDDEGKEYLDFLGGYGALNLGHNVPEIKEALNKAFGRPNLLQASLNPLAAALARNLTLIAPPGLKRSFFCNSGAEAVEGALKTARIASGRQKIIYCEGSFHGKTMGALSVTGRMKYQTPFHPLVQMMESIPYGDAEALEKSLSKRDVAAFIVEPIQGEGGIIVPPSGYLKKVREICSRYGTLLIADEIQTGFGRTGKMFACQHEDVTPDLMCIAKSLGGSSMPIGAFMATEEVWDKAYGGVDKALLHTSTFGGNSMACAAGITAVKLLIERGYAERAAKMGSYMLGRLNELKEKHPLLVDVRGKGLMIGIEFAKPEGLLNKITGGLVSKLSQEYLGAMVAGELINNYGIITAYTLNNPNVMRFEPPLTVTEEEVDKVIAALDEILTKNKNLMGMAKASVKTAVSSFFKR